MRKILRQQEEEKLLREKEEKIYLFIREEVEGEFEENLKRLTKEIEKEKAE